MIDKASGCKYRARTLAYGKTLECSRLKGVVTWKTCRTCMLWEERETGGGAAKSTDVPALRA